jgi:hypothetical protein
MTYYVATRNGSSLSWFPTLADAIRHGLSLKQPFDVSLASGAWIWLWGQGHTGVPE